MEEGELALCHLTVLSGRMGGSGHPNWMGCLQNLIRMVALWWSHSGFGGVME